MPKKNLNTEWVRQIVKADGWRYVYSRGSHDFYIHPIKKGKITIPSNLRTMAPKNIDHVFEIMNYGRTLPAGVEFCW